MAAFIADLHTHSTASDGALAPAALVQRAARLGLSVLALTDHDTTAGVDEAASTAAAADILFVPGIELSTEAPVGDLHILGYGIDPSASVLRNHLAELREQRIRRIDRMLARLRELGIDIPTSTVRPGGDDASVGRPHIARALVAAGYVSSVHEAFDRYLGDGRPAFIAIEHMPAEDAIELIRLAGGLPVMAHPLSLPNFTQRLPALVAAGLRGLECYYGRYDQSQREALVRTADAAGLIATGGTDFHGDDYAEDRDLGSVEIPQARVEQLLRAIGRLH